VKDFDFHLTLFDPFGRARQVCAGYREEASGVVNLDLTFASSAGWYFGLDEDMDPAPRRRELRVGIQLLDDLSGRFLYLTDLRVPDIVQVDTGVRIYFSEDEPNATTTRLLRGF